MEKQRQLRDGLRFPAMMRHHCTSLSRSPCDVVSSSRMKLLHCAGCVLSISTYFFHLNPMEILRVDLIIHFHRRGNAKFSDLSKSTKLCKLGTSIPSPGSHVSKKGSSALTMASLEPRCVLAGQPTRFEGLIYEVLTC